MQRFFNIKDVMAVTDEYFWDASLWSPLWSLLDPAMEKAHIKSFLTLNYHGCYARDFISGGPTGPWYAAIRSFLSGQQLHRYQ